MIVDAIHDHSIDFYFKAITDHLMKGVDHFGIFIAPGDSCENSLRLQYQGLD
jgi:hypothetical protein